MKKDCNTCKHGDRKSWESTCFCCSCGSGWEISPDILIAALKKEVRRLATWIVQHPPELPDHACGECVPNGDMVKPKFVCTYHNAVKIVKLNLYLPAEKEDNEHGRQG